MGTESENVKNEMLIMLRLENVVHWGYLPLLVTESLGEHR